MPDLTRVQSYQYPSGHLGHLSASEQDALNSFKQLCEQKGYYRPAVPGRAAASHDDETMLRYLRARKFSPQDAWGQFKDTEDWRKENHLEELYDTIDIHEYEQTRRLYPQWIGRRDRRGIPVYLFRVADLNSKAVAEYEKSVSASSTVSHNPKSVPTKMLRLFALYENLTRFVMPLCSAVTDRPNAETPISQSNNIVDISNVGLKQFWNLKAHMQDASTLATAHYPETLDRIFIIGAPSFFPTVWGWIKRWFDPITVSKIFILSNANMKSTLETYIDPANIPRKYGGTLDFEWGMMPILDPFIEQTLNWHNASTQAGHKTIPTGPIKWRESKDGTMTAYAVGSEKGQPRNTPIASLTTNFRGMHGVSRQNTNIGYPLAPTTTPGTSTQNIPEGDMYFGTHPGDQTPRTGSFSQQETAGSNYNTTGSSYNTTGSNYNTSGSNDNTFGSNYTPDMRTGTSSTRYAGQEGTHGQGQLQEGTPHDALNDHGHGDKSYTMEPRTVGQAPKDPMLPRGETDDSAPGYVEQAKEMATSAVTSAMAAVGLAEKHEEPKEEVHEKKRDERVNQMEQKDVEEFLRAQYSNHPPSMK